MVTFILLVIGGLNWLLFGLFGNEIGGWVLGGMMSTLSKVVYILVGVSAIIEVATHKRNCKMCGTSMPAGDMKPM